MTAETKYEKKVALVKSYPNSDPGVVDYYADKGYRGIIVEGTGLGHGCGAGELVTVPIVGRADH